MLYKYDGIGRRVKKRPKRRSRNMISCIMEAHDVSLEQLAKLGFYITTEGNLKCHLSKSLIKQARNMWWEKTGENLWNK